MKRILATFTFLVLSNAAFAAKPTPVTVPQTVPEPLPIDPMKATVHRLSNGLTIYLSPNNQEPRISAWVVVRAGSKMDPDDSTGLAHYLEHMLFKGSDKLDTLNYQNEKPHLDKITQLYERLFKTTDLKARKEIYARIDAENIQASKYEAPNEIDKLYKSLGFRGVNAFTSDERTVFVCDFPSNRTELWARVESDRFQNAVFRMFQSELEAVYEEKNRTMDNADEILREAIEKHLFKEHPYGTHTTIGTIEHLKNPSLEKMYWFYHTYYHPNNMALVLSGDFDRSSIIPLLEKYFGGWKPAPLPPAKTWPLPKPGDSERVEVKYEAEEQVVISWLTAPHGSPDADALTVMDMLMDNAETGILNIKLNQDQKVKSSGSYPEFNNDAGQWSVWAVPKKDQTLEQVEALLNEAVDDIKAGKFSDSDIRAIITDFEVNEKLRLESNQARTSEMADSFAHLEDWQRAAGRLERLRKVTRDDVMRAAQKYLGLQRVVAYRREGKAEIPSIEKPNFTKIALDPAMHSKFFMELLRMPAAPIEPKWLAAGRDYHVLSAPWGKLYAAKNPMNDLFDIEFQFDRGYRNDRELCEAASLADFAGAGSLDAEAFKKKLYSLGTKLSVGCGEYETTVNVSGLDSHFDESLKLVQEHFASPAIASDTLKKMIEVHIGAHRDNKKNPRFIGWALGEYVMRGKDGGALTELSDAELRQMKEPDLRKLIQTFFDYQRKVLYVGIRDPKTIVEAAAIGQNFQPLAPRPAMAYLMPSSPRVVFSHRDQVQSHIGLFAADTAYNPDEAVDYKFYRTYMGGMSGVLFQEVRETRSLAYEVHGGYNTGDHKGDENYLWGHAGCQYDKTQETASLMKDLLNKTPGSPDRFDEAYRSMEQDYRTGVITFRGIPGAVVHWEELGLPGDPRPENFQKALKYQLGDLLRFSKRFETKPLTIYILGNKNKVDLAALKSLGPVEEVPIDSLFPY